MKVADTETMKNNKTKSPKCFLPKRKKSVAPKNPLTTPPAFGVIQESKKKNTIGAKVHVLASHEMERNRIVRTKSAENV